MRYRFLKCRKNTFPFDGQTNPMAGAVQDGPTAPTHGKLEWQKLDGLITTTITIILWLAQPIFESKSQKERCKAIRWETSDI